MWDMCECVCVGGEMKKGSKMELTRRGLGSEVELRTRAPAPFTSYDPLGSR